MKIHLSLGFKKHWIDSLSPTDVHSLVLGTTNPPCDGGSSCHYMMTEKSPVHGIHLYTWYMGPFYPSQALDDPTPLALELENIPHCQKQKHKLKISVKVGYIRNNSFSSWFQIQRVKRPILLWNFVNIYLLTWCMGVFHLVSTPYPRTWSSN